MIPLARSVTSSRSSVHAPVDRYFQPPSAETTTMEADSPSPNDAAHFTAPARAAPVEIPAKIPTSVRRRVHSIDSRGRTTVLRFEQLGPAQLLEDGRDVAVVEVAQPVDHLAGGRLHRPDRHGVTQLLAQEAADAEQRARGPQPGHEVGDRRAVPQDLGAGALVVGPRIGRVGVLVQEDPLGMLLGQATGHADGTVGSLRARATR